MPEKKYIDNVEYIPASRAGKIFSYTPDYISKLARDGKIRATRDGRRWYVDVTSVKEFVEQSIEDKRIRGEEIRVERKLELKKCRVRAVNTGSPFLALAQTLIVVVLGFWIGFGGYIVVGNEHQPAQVSRNDFERLAITVYRLISGFVEQPVVIGSLDNVPQRNSYYGVDRTHSTTTFTTLIVAEDELFTAEQLAEVRASFSDEIEISVDPRNPDTGIITPIFRERRGDDYRFLMMPISKPTGS